MNDRRLPGGAHAFGLRLNESHAGFTLVEMLVAVTIVLMMMVMFGEIFQLASGSVTKQRVIADNDQNARTFVTVIRADLDKRTFRTVVPYFAGELSSNRGTPFEKRRGYFYVSTNNTADGSDDVLQFTVDAALTLRNSDESPYFGHAVQLPGTFLQNPNQPDWDDGQLTPNQAGASRAAEVSYWLRGGRLYRRVMLLREPIKAAGVSKDPIQAAQPAPTGGSDYFSPTNMPPYTGEFWSDFDYSTHRLPASLADPSMLLLPANARFNGIDMLSNDQSVLPHPLRSPPAGPFTPGQFHPYAYSLGQTWNRFGHNHEIAGSAGLTLPGAPYTPAQNGLSREFATNVAAPPAGSLRFFGRFTQEETSHTAFNYPQAASTVGNGNPMDGDTTNTTGNILTDSDANGTIDQFAGGTRIGQDLLLSNVHEFRVEVWDQRIGNFAPVGHNIGVGDYNLGRQLNPTYAPLGGQARIFDTWHPNFDRNFNIPTIDPAPPGFYDVSDRPPFRALNYDPAGISGAVPPGPTPSAPFVAGFWAPDTTYSVGDVVFPRTEDFNGNGLLDAGEDGTCGFPGMNGADDPPRMRTLVPNFSSKLQFRPFGLTYAYRCIKAGHTLGSGTGPFSLNFEPYWSSTPGMILRGNDETAAGFDIDADGNNNEVEPDWIVDYNVRPLRAIRITVRYEHPQSKQMRQVTLVHSLRDTSTVP